MQRTQTPDQFLSYSQDTAPVWAFDFDNHRMLWANEAGLTFWKANSFAEFVSRDYSGDSRAVRDRLRQSVSAAKSGEWLRESWTLFPEDQPVTVVMDARLIEHEETDTAILFRVVGTFDFAHADPEGLRMMLAARVTPVAVSMFDLNGSLISENPAGLALRLQTPEWSERARHLASRYGTSNRANEIIAAVKSDENATFEYQTPGNGNSKVLAVTARRIRDPVTGDVVAQITEEDITEKAALAASLAEINETLERRVVERSRELEEANTRLKAEIEQRKEAQRQVERERDFFKHVQEIIPVAIFHKNEAGKYVDCNEMWCEQLGLPREKVIGSSFQDTHDLERGDDAAPTDALVLKTGKGGRFPMKLARSDGEVRTVISCKAPIKRWDGETWIVGAVFDVTEQKAIERDLRHREVVLREATAATKTAFMVYDNVTRKVEYFSESYKDLVGAPDGLFEKILKDVDNRFSLLPAGLGERARDIVGSAENAKGSFDFTFDIQGGPAKGRSISARGHPIPSSDLGDNKRVTIMQDVTEAVATQERLRQAQKLEAIGRLTGGIAHDFNNLLAVMQGNIELMQVTESFDDELAQEVVKACQRGADLTRNLLAYARQQPLASEAVDLRQRTKSIEKILQRTLGEDINLSVSYSHDLWVAKVDPGQVDDALLNLALNARDACQSGGNLNIGFSNLKVEGGDENHANDIKPGDYVVITVTDNGMGMAPDVLEKATDPFFTTKAVGEGTGLGLSMVYGFAKQSDGNLTIYSEVGHGTTVRLYLPRHYDNPVSESLNGAEPSLPMGRGETIVVVEDDPAIGRLAVRTLKSLDYNVVVFERGQAALDYLRKGGQMDLLLTDVILPGGMRGPELAEIVRSEVTDPKILFMSGYPADASKKNGFVGSGTVLLSKPIRRSELAIAIRNMLNSAQ